MQTIIAARAGLVGHQKNTAIEVWQEYINRGLMPAAPPSWNNALALGSLLANIGWTPQVINTWMNFASLKSVISQGKMVLAIIRWKGAPATYHFVLISGVLDGHNQGVFVWDPVFAAGKPRFRSYNALRHGYPNGSGGAGFWAYTHVVG